MAKALAFNYRFNPAADSVTIDGNISIKRMLLITNVTDNIVIQNFADPAKKILSRSYDRDADETTFVLQYDCASMSATDSLQVFYETDTIRFQPDETFIDPVSKMRMSQPNTLIDTDFEYGLQATKWETLERLNQVPAFHSVTGDTPLTNILDVTTNGTNVVTVTTSSPHGLTVGFPIDVRGVDSPTAEGTFIVKRTGDTSFTYEARAVQAGTASVPVSILTSYVNITPGRFYVGSQIPLDDSVANTTGPIVTNAANPSTLTLKTSYTHGMAVSSTYYLVNTLSNSSLSFSAIGASAGGDVEDRSSVSLSTGNFSMYEPFHDGTRRFDILDSAVDTINETLTIPNHGMLTGDMIAYVGVSSGGADPQVASVIGGSYPISAGALPRWAAGTGANGSMLYVVKINNNTIRLATNPRDAYNNTNLIGFTGTGSGTLTFAHFLRGTDVEEYISTITGASGSSELVVQLASGFTNDMLKIIPEQQFTIAECAVAALNGVYYVKTTGWDKDATTFTLIGPTNTSSVLAPQSASQTYTMVDTGGNNTTSFDRYNSLLNTGMRIIVHNGPTINHMRVSMHDWKSTTAKFFTRECIQSDQIFIKNHGLTVGQPLMLILGGNTLSGGTATDTTVYFASVVNLDTIQLMTTETGSAGSTGPYSATVGVTAATFGTLGSAQSLAGGVYSIHPGFQIANFTSQTVSGGNGTGRDRAIGKFTTGPGYLYEGVPIVIKSAAGATPPTPITATVDTYTSYQKYYVRTILAADSRLEFSLGLQDSAGPLVEFTGATTVGSGFFGFRIDENVYSNSFYLKNHGGVTSTQTVGTTGAQGTFPAGIGYPGPLFDKIVDPGTGYDGLVRVRTTLTQSSPPAGLTNSTIYNMVPITSDIFKVMAWNDTTLPTGQPTVQFTNIASRTSTVVFANSAVVNVNANRIVIPSQRLGQLVENSVVRYKAQGNLNIPSSYTGWPGLIDNNQYIVRNVVSSSFFELGLFTTQSYSATATTIVLNDATGLSTGDTLRVTTFGTTNAVRGVNGPIQWNEGSGSWGFKTVENSELLLVTNLVGTTLTVTRGHRGTTALPILQNTFIQKEYASFQLFATEQTLPRALNSLTGTTATNLYLATAHGLRTGDTLFWQSGASGNPAFVTNFPYYAVVSDANNFGVADTLTLAQAAVLHDVNATTATSWTQFYSSIPLTGLGSSPLGSHLLEDTSATGTIDGGYTATAVSANTLQFTSNVQIPNRSFTFYPEDTLDLLTGEFFIRNHGFTTGTRVTYTRNLLTFAIGDGSGNPVAGYNRLVNNTEYFVIRTSLNSFKLATSRANAFAGTAITRYSSPGTSGGHTLSTAQVSGESLQSGLATIIARDIVFNGSDNNIVVAGADRIIATAHGFRSGDRVIYQVWGGGRQVNGLVNGRQYFISNSVFTGATSGGAAAGQTANQFSLHNTWVGAYTNTDRADILGVGTGRVHQFKVTNPTLFGTTFRGEWSTADSYRSGDVVLFRNSYYMSVTGSDFATGTTVFNSGRQPVNESGQIETNWMPCPVLPAYGTTFLTQYRGGSRVRLSNTITRVTRFFSAGDAARVIVADDRINFSQTHGLFSGQAVIYRTDAKGGWHQGTAGTATPYRGTGGFVPQTAINGLTPNRIYYVNYLGANDITLHTSPPLAVRGGSGDSGNFDFAVELVSLGVGEFHRFEVVNNVIYDMEVLAVTNNSEMIVSDPYPSRSITFNPQETNVHVSGLAMQVVDIALDTIYIPNHGLDTGVKVYYSAGVIGSGTAIGGLTDGTAYFVINLTPDHIRLATTIANAYVGVQQDLTNTGTGILHYLIAATTSGSSWIRYNATGDINTDTTGLISNSSPYSNQVVGNIRDGVLIGLPMIGVTEAYPRPDCTNVHRPFDGGVEINASRTPGVSIVRQTRKYFRYQSGKGLQYSTGINFSPSIEVSRIVHDGVAWATVTTRKPHKLQAGNKIIVRDVGFTTEYEADKCERDLAYIIEGGSYDVALGTNYNAIFLGIAEVNSLEITQRVINNITLSKQEVAQLSAVSSDGTALSRSNAFYDEVLDIIQNGRGAANAVSYTNPGTATVSQIAAKDKLVANKAFIAAEVNAWVAVNYPNSQHDVAKCTRDVNYLVDALGYDILYGGNSATYDVARFFFYVYESKKPGTSALHRAQTVAAYQRISAIIDDIVQGNSIVKSAGNALFQDTTGNNANSGDAAVVVSLVDIVVNSIDEVSQEAGLAALPTKVYPSITWATAGIQAAKNAIAAAQNTIIQDIVRGLYYTTPASGNYFLVDSTNLTDFSFRYRTTAVPADLTPAGYISLFVESWNDAAVRAGMFDDQNGLFYEYDGQTLYCVRRNSTKQLGGTATVTRNSNTVTGLATNFQKQLDLGDFIVIRGQSYKVTKITSDTVIEISPSYRGTTRSKVVITKTEEARFPQHEWSIDVCDGTGPTGFNLDINKMQMAYIDFSWYGAGKVRFGFKGTDGKVIYVHEIRHNNREIEAYMRSGNLPARYEVVNGNAPTYAPSLYHWGASVIMDGGFEDDKAYLFTVASGSGGSDTITIPTTLAGIPVPVLSIRLAPSVDSSIVGALGERDLINRMSITLKQVGLVVTQTNRPASVRLILNGNLAQAAYFSNYGAPSLTQLIKHTGQATDSITGGVTIYEFRAAANSPVTAELEALAEIGNSILGGDYVFPNGPDILTVAVVTTDTTTASQITARITWAESQA